MDHISKHLNNQGRSTTTTPAGETRSSVNPQTIQLVNEIFVRLRAIHPAWKQSLQDTAAENASKKEWLGGLMDAGICDWGVIQAGVDACRGSGSPFWPSVGQFIGYCQSAACERIGALSTMDAYGHLLAYYAKPTQFREPCDLDVVVYHMTNQPGFDTYNFRRMKTEDSVKYFTTHHKAALNHVGAGGELNRPIRPELRIDNPSGVVHGNDEELARKTLDELMRTRKE